MTATATKSKTTNIPNSFQNPNWIIDDLLHLLTSDEGKVLWYMVRHILGWEKERSTRKKQISRSMFENGYIDNDGNVYHGVGLSSAVIRNCTNALVKYGVINQGETTNDGTWWELPDNPKVDWVELHKRFEKVKNAATKKISKAAEIRRKNIEARRKGVSTDDSPIVGQQVGGIVERKVGGIVPRQESNPLSNPLSNPPNAHTHEGTEQSTPEPVESKAAQERGGEGGEQSVKGKQRKASKPRKLTDEHYATRQKLFEIVCIGSFGKQWQNINGSKGFASKISQNVHLERPDITPEKLEAGYRYFSNKFPDVLKDVNKRLKDVDKILHYVGLAEEAATIVNAPRKIPDPKCKVCGGDGVTIDRATNTGKPCHCLHYPEKDGAK